MEDKFYLEYDGEHGGYSDWFLWGGWIDHDSPTLAYNKDADLPFIYCPGSECFVREDFISYFKSFEMTCVRTIAFSGDWKFEVEKLEGYLDMLPSGEPSEILDLLVQYNVVNGNEKKFFYLEDGQENDYLSCDDFDVMYPTLKFKGILDEYMVETENVFWPKINWGLVD